MKTTKTRHWIGAFALTLIAAAPFGLVDGFADGLADKEPASQIRLVGVGTIAGDELDLTGLDRAFVPTVGTSSDEIPEGRVFSNNMFGGISAIAWTGKDDFYWMLPDRGPLDGAVDWTCRVQKVRLIVDPSGTLPVQTELVETILLYDHRNIPFTGSASAFKESDTMTARLDPEGIRVGSNGNLFISDEYGPRLIEFTESGKFVQEFQLPDCYLAANPDVSKSSENIKNKLGRATNRGMEGLAVSQDGSKLFGLMQSPLLQDCERKSLEIIPRGRNCRLAVFGCNGNCAEEFVYHLDDRNNGLNEILCCGPNQFVVIERDGSVGDKAGFKKLMLISTESASVVSAADQLPQDELPSEMQSVSKTVLIDLLADQWGLAGEKMPEKLEGLAFGPDIDENNRLLLVVSDNDFVPEHDTMIYAFAVPRVELATQSR